RNERECDAELFTTAEQIVFVDETDGEADQRRLRRQGDVALFPGGAEADHFFSLVLSFGDVADIAHGGGIGTGGWSGQYEAGHFQSVCQPWKVIFLLFRRAVLLDQLTGAKRVRHHHKRTHIRRARCDPAEDQRLSLARKPEAAMLLGDEHAEEAIVLG